MALPTPLTILLVEDGPEDRAIYRRYLSRQTAAAYTCIEGGNRCRGPALVSDGAAGLHCARFFATRYDRDRG
jgi:hypothetical protein